MKNAFWVRAGGVNSGLGPAQFLRVGDKVGCSGCYQKI